MDIVSMDMLMLQTNALPEDAPLLEIYAEAAEEKVLDDIRIEKTEELQREDGSYPATIIQAVLMLAGHYYRNREATTTVTMSQIPLGYAHLIKSFRKFKPNWRQKS